MKEQTPAEELSEQSLTNRRFDVTIAGEINLDLILYGLPEVMQMERELLASDFKITLGGSSAIVAHNLASLGMKVGFVTRVGPDDFGKLALERLVEGGVDVSEIQSGGSTGTGVTVLLSHGSERHILTYLGTIAKLTAESLPLDYLESSRHFHLSSLYLQRGLQPGLPELLKRLKGAGLTVSLDTNDDPEGEWGGILDDILEFVDILLPSEGELIRMAHASTLEDALEVMGRRVPVIVVKCGARGSLVQQGQTREDVPGLPVVPVDTIGAGDSFNAGFLSAYLRGASVVEAARMGNITGALSTLAAGGTEAFRDAVLRDSFLSQHLKK
ncbi:carbohydrate kinase family protein [Granulicella sp. dw_53]|uniref:carbohydrate kinase family protein n=1 Tax=Granulicella sp. dw_53 TaxID=2719792 RepID=UPI001BD46CCC|nr:carbohydrate kinase family protein [Granulicella sp. dw_53]